jgi:uncharacterized membrane protein YphA (DoxX/SURF4 family)
MIDAGKENRIMNTAITVVQIVIGVLFMIGGLAKILVPYDRYSSIGAVAWSKEFKPEHIKFAGLLEVAASLGLLVPLILPSLTVLIPLAAIGIALYMAGAMSIHLRRSEYLHMVGNLLVFLVPALFVAYGSLVGFTA